jgi:hypothetical protein
MVLEFFRGLFSKKVPVPTGPVPAPRPSAFPIAVVNQTTVVTDAQVQALVVALQIQVSRDFAPVYGVDAALTFVPKGHTPPPGNWWLLLADTSDQAGALGYHDLTNEGLPIGKAFIKSDIQAGASWTVTVSHELLEMLADPWINLTVFVQPTETTGKLYAYEVCDTCEADHLGYPINGLQVSDFAFPEWWGVPGSKRRLDFMGHVTRVLQILPGGYIGEFDVTKGGGWTQKTSEKVIHAHREDYKVGSRRERRARGTDNWKSSKATHT